MSRKPRKCPVRRKRERRQRERADWGTPEQLERFRLLVGRKKRNPKDSAAENPVRVLHARGYLNDMQASAMLGYGFLWRMYASQFMNEPTATIEGRELAGNGSISMPNHYRDMSAEQKEIEFRRLDKAIEAKGLKVRAFIRDIATEPLIDTNNLQIGFPRFFIRQYCCERKGKDFEMTRVELNELAMLKAGADALLGR